ncbi:DNA repair protein RadC [Anaerocolumna aminovalerica]|jgi:DNA repair protein RadC|uniref:DNA replication and repair protein RadC n=1 Tax=Anaerocolumna aminovalerica TaxID=1527 RepID=A0A1I5CJ09_9FIRM|nr:DNA repair protein RadC [Anaerocolumna aminovalerica]MBU5332609.1 DNA repair protein RadC [Anaerocolumna aminovalerica]MDU6264993.1 DNA repair protein RadC [Anaerocolumna aminovalerica]SFN87000.1 DNA replication and repair protein RadC [Anaerocolumna aminovalerica]
MNKKFYTVKELPLSERPYDKCEKYGPSVLSDAELLAVIIRSGSKNERVVDVATRVLNYSKVYPGLLGLNHMNMNDLISIKGIGRVKAIQLLCMTELTKRMAKATNADAIRLTNPSSVANYYMQDMRHLTQEKVLLIMLDSKSKILKDMIISSGTVNSSLLSPREIFLHALKYEAVSIIILHNHPSGDPTPSKEDIHTTKRLKEVGNLIGIKLMDHIIIGDNKYISLNEEGYL